MHDHPASTDLARWPWREEENAWVEKVSSARGAHAAAICYLIRSPGCVARPEPPGSDTR